MRLPWLIVGVWACGTGAAYAQPVVPLESLDLSKMHQGRGKPAVVAKGLDLGGRHYAPAVRTHARSVLWLQLDGRAEKFHAVAGVDQGSKAPSASVRFSVIGDGRVLWQSAVLGRTSPAVTVDVPLAGVQLLCLLVGDAGDGNEGDQVGWAEARFTVRGAAPQPISHPAEEAVMLTPQPGPAPRINGPVVYGCRPGNPFLYRIPTTGRRPMRFAAENLPAGLTLDAGTGIITGTAPAAGAYHVRLQAVNDQGRSSKRFKIVAGDTLSLTPSMGWNHWYAHYNRVTDVMMREAADVMVASGMADAGYQYVNIDDCWMNASPEARHNKDPRRVGPFRDAQGNILCNVHFPDMKAMTAYIHARGLKAGIYTSPGPMTCAGYAGAYQHEAQDARQFADWGFDFLKYDWCSYGKVVQGDKSLAAMMRPYKLMGDLLKQQKRDILYNLCQYGMGDVWEWGTEVEGQSWRTAGDLGYELNRIFEVALKNAEHRAYSRPGSWNDPDYLQIGYIGPAGTQTEPRPCDLTPTEQYAFMSLWCLMASPLFYSGDMSRLDPFTLNVLCNPEVIDIDQDPLGQCAQVIPQGEEQFLMVKRMADGSTALGLCNRSELPCKMTARWSDLRLNGRQIVRDVWRHKDLGPAEGEFTADVGRRGVVLVRLRPEG